MQAKGSKARHKNAGKKEQEVQPERLGGAGSRAQDDEMAKRVRYKMKLKKKVQRKEKDVVQPKRQKGGRGSPTQDDGVEESVYCLKEREKGVRAQGRKKDGS